MERGAGERYTIPASNAFGLPPSVWTVATLRQLVRGENSPNTPLKRQQYENEMEGAIQVDLFGIRKAKGRQKAMRRRNISFMFRLNEQEAEAFRERVKRSGLTQESYLRQVISGKMPRDAPPPDYYAMMRELHKIGNNLNQIAQKAHVLNVIDVQRYDRDMRKFEETVRLITEAVILPETAEQQEAGSFPSGADNKIGEA